MEFRLASRLLFLGLPTWWQAAIVWQTVAFREIFLEVSDPPKA
jgi:hypothetical protein